MAEMIPQDRNLLGLASSELEEFARACGQPSYRGKQIYRAIYARRECDFMGMTELDRRFREFLSAGYRIELPESRERFESRDGSCRHVLTLRDGAAIETVFMPEDSRITLCLSSQVGCAVDCRFCFTGLLGLRRNLTAGEIVGQVLALLRDPPRRTGRQLAATVRLNVVFMGMGEPLLNLKNVLKAVKLLADPEGVGVALRRITLSTSGIVPRIVELAREPVRPKLAISLNASTDEQRTALMPLNRTYPLKALLAACRAYPLRPRERLTFEYVLLEGINDSDRDAARVAELLRGIRSKVNLIPYNSGPELPYRPPPLERVLAFQEVLTERGLPAFIRISRGQDVMGACGQLSLRDAKEPGRGTLS